MELQGQVAIITGAGRGIGRATALELGRMAQSARAWRAGLTARERCYRKSFRRFDPRLERCCLLGKAINAAPAGRAQPFSDELSPEFGDGPDQHLVPAGGQVIAG